VSISTSLRSALIDDVQLEETLCDSVTDVQAGSRLSWRCEISYPLSAMYLHSTCGEIESWRYILRDTLTVYREIY